MYHKAVEILNPACASNFLLYKPQERFSEDWTVISKKCDKKAVQGAF